MLKVRGDSSIHVIYRYIPRKYDIILFPKHMVIDFLNKGPAVYDKFEEMFNDYYVKIFDELKLEGEYITDVTIVDNKTIHRINREFRNVDRPTDVISFAFLDDEAEKSLKGGPINLGQIIISYEKAESQAEEYGHSINREMVFLFVHGMLHLLGYDHSNDDEEKIMFDLQDKILGGLK